MHPVLTIPLLFLLTLCNNIKAQAVSDTMSQYAPAVASGTKPPPPDDRVRIAQVLHLKDNEGKEWVMLVVADAPFDRSWGRSKLKINYLLRRERSYLSNIFFANVKVLEELPAAATTEATMKLLQPKYEGLKFWASLRTETLFPF